MAGNLLSADRDRLSESLLLGALLALNGGFMDVYTYVCRGEVFAHAQTGNILLFGVHLAEGEWDLALHYACPVMAFMLGVAVARLARHRFEQTAYLHWRQLTLLLEAGVLLGISFIPQSGNLLATSLTSLACGIQVESFRKIWGSGVATVMCIGNLRTATAALCDYHCTGERAALRRGLMVFGVIGLFILGAVVGNFAIRQWGEHAIRLCCLPLLAAVGLLFFDKEPVND